MATSIDQKNFVKTALRLPPELHAAVHEAAQRSGRSYNAELVERVQRSFEADEQDQYAEMLYEMRRTQLRLELNDIKSELQLLYARHQDNVRSRDASDRPDAAAIALAEEDAIKKARKELDVKGKLVLAKLAALEEARKARKPKP